MMGRPRVQGENTHSECIACIPPSYARKGCHPSQLLSRYSIESLSAGRKLTTSQRTGLSQLRRPPRGHNEKSHIAAAALRTPLPIQSMRSAPATLKTTKPPSIQAVTPPSTSARRCVSPQSKLDIHLHTRQKARMAQASPPARAALPRRRFSSVRNRRREVFPYAIWSEGSKIAAAMAAHPGMLLSHSRSLSMKIADVVLQSLFRHHLV